MNNRTAVGGSTGSAIALLVVYIGSRLGWHLTPEDGATAATAGAAAVAFIAHYGIRGVFRLIWRGAPSV